VSRSNKPLRIVYPEQQHYACRDCPARCCRTPWGIPLTPEVAHTILEDTELRSRLVGRAPGILANGTLPMIEKDRQLQCVLLEDDLMCGLQKRHGHAALPQACQAYPFGFMKNEQGQDVALLSRHCPSIRDNYGEPLAGQIEAKFKQAGGSYALAPRMGLPSGRTLPVPHYLQLANAWRQLFLAGSPLEAVRRCYALTEAFDEELPALPSPSEADVRSAWAAAEQCPALALASPTARPPYQARLFYAHELGNLCYPSRVLTAFSTRRPTWSQRLGTWRNKLNWLFEVGSVDLLYVSGPVRLGRINQVPAFLSGDLGQLVSRYLIEVLDRRQVFVRQTYLTRVVVDLGLMAALVSRFARASAVGHGRAAVARTDVLEGLGVADLLMAHQAGAAQSTLLANLRLHLMSDSAAFDRFLASEA